MFCVKCGKEISEGTKFCPYCGNQVTSEGNIPAAPEGKTGNTKKVIIALSAIVAVLVLVVGVLLMNNRGSDNDTSQANTSSVNEDSQTSQTETKEHTPNTPFYDGWIENNPRFECFETAGGKDVIASFYEENGQIMLKIGDENPVSIIYDDAIEGYEGYADDGSHIIIKAVSGNEIEIAGYKDYYGTYIGSVKW